MAGGARVQDVDAIRAYRAALIKFIEAGNSALTDAESEITKRIGWLEGEQTAFWQHQIRKLMELISQLKEAIRSKTLFKDATGRTQSAFDEQKKLKAALARLEIAEQKLANTRRWAKQLQREHLLYRGGVQRLQSMLATDLVNGVASLDRSVAQLQAYLAAGAPSLATSDAGDLDSPAVTTDGGAMKRSADQSLSAEDDPVDKSPPTETP